MVERRPWNILLFGGVADLLSEEGAGVELVEGREEGGGLALQRGGESEHRYEVRNARSALDLADAALRNAEPLREIVLRESSFLAKVTHVIAKQFARCSCRRHPFTRSLTIPHAGYMIIGMCDSTLTERIRIIFLHHESRVTIDEAAHMLGWTTAELNAAIKSGDIEPIGTCSGKMIALREVAMKALDLWSLNTVEDALGPDAKLIMPPALRTRKITLRLPLYQIGALKVLAEDGRESVDTMLMRMFEELTDLNKERLSRLIPGLAEAIGWPEREEGEQPS